MASLMSNDWYDTENLNWNVYFAIIPLLFAVYIVNKSR